MSIIGRRIPAFATTLASNRAVYDAESEARLAEWQATFNEAIDLADARDARWGRIEAAAKAYLDDIRYQEDRVNWSPYLDELDKAIRS